MLAAMRGRTETVKILLEHGAAVNTKDKDGKLHTIIVTISIHLSVYIFICVYSSYMSICRKDQSYVGSNEG